MAKRDTSDCLICGTPPEPDTTTDGLRWTVEVCTACTREIAARALRRMVPKLLRERLER